MPGAGTGPDDGERRSTWRYGRQASRLHGRAIKKKKKRDQTGRVRCRVPCVVARAYQRRSPANTAGRPPRGGPGGGGLLERHGGGGGVHRRRRGSRGACTIRAPHGRLPTNTRSPLRQPARRPAGRTTGEPLAASTPAASRDDDAAPCAAAAPPDPRPPSHHFGGGGPGGPTHGPPTDSALTGTARTALLGCS
jgi:hypothetical protein